MAGKIIGTDNYLIGTYWICRTNKKDIYLQIIIVMGGKHEK